MADGLAEGRTQNVAQAMDKMSVSVVLTDPRIEDNPITFVNDAFEKLTLYSRDDAVGRNCRFLQGPGTEPEAVDAIRRGLANHEEVQVVITNYKADGTPFRNRLLISPVLDEDDNLFGFFGMQHELEPAEEPNTLSVEALGLLHELQHRVKNHLSMVVSMIRLQASHEVTPESLRAVGRRVEALALLYDEMFGTTTGGQSDDMIRTGAYLGRIASVISSISDHSAVRVDVDCDEVELPVDQAARLGLLLSELLTNALEHGFPDRASGLVSVRFKELNDGSGVRLTVADDGVGLPEGSNWPYEAASIEAQKDRAEHESGTLDLAGGTGRPGVGGTIVTGLTQMLEASLRVERADPGTVVTVDFETQT